MEEAGVDADAVTLAAWLTIGAMDVWTAFERAGQLLTFGAQLIKVETFVEYAVASWVAEGVQTGAAPLQEVMVL